MLETSAPAQPREAVLASTLMTRQKLSGGLGGTTQVRIPTFKLKNSLNI